MKELTTVRPNDEGGIIGLIGLKYQYHFAIQECLKMTLSQEPIEYVAIELHDDVVTKLNDGTYKFFQVKGREGSLWTINTLKHKKVWQGFLRCKKIFGEGHSYWFVSDQDCQNRVSNRPDLGRMKQLTQMTIVLCRETDLNHADEIIQKLMKEIEFENEEQARSLFWNTRIIRKDNTTLILENLNLIEQILVARGLPSGLINRKQVYKELRSFIEEGLVPIEPALTLREILEARKITVQDVENCFNIPFQDTQPGNFDFSSDNNRTLEQKMRDAEFSNPLKRYFLESRNRFTSRFLKDAIHSANILKDLRWKVWSICIEAQTSTASGNHIALYDSIKSELRELARKENESNPGITIDYDYVHGMLCQLTAECNHEWIALREN